MESFCVKRDCDVGIWDPTQNISNKTTKNVFLSEPSLENEVKTKESSKTSQESTHNDSEEDKKVYEKDNEPEIFDTYEPDDLSGEDDIESMPYPDEYNPELVNASQFIDRWNPTHQFYLTKTSQIPESLFEPKYMSKNVFEKVILASYSRSGNTLLRKYLQDITGVITGSDVDVRRGLCSYLVDKGMKGEGKINNRVWIIKTHFPESDGYKKFLANKCVLLVRNPMDSIMSLYNMIVTGTHSAPWQMKILRNLIHGLICS